MPGPTVTGDKAISTLSTFTEPGNGRNSETSNRHSSPSTSMPILSSEMLPTSPRHEARQRSAIRDDWLVWSRDVSRNSAGPDSGSVEILFLHPVRPLRKYTECLLMAVPPLTSSRRRTSSYVDATNSDQPTSLPRRPTDESELFVLGSFCKPVRYRRKSFALAGERNTTIDELIDSASLNATTAAAVKEAAEIASVASPSPEVAAGQNAKGILSPCPPGSDIYVKHLSTSTVVPQPNGLFSHFDKTITPSVPSVEDVFQLNSLPGQSNACDDLPGYPHEFHNSEISCSHPLASKLVKQYLAKVAVNPQSNGFTLYSSPPTSHPIELDNLPGLLRFDAPAMASMTIPVPQLRRACATSASKTKKVDGQPSCSHPDTSPFMRIPDCGTWTDTNYSSDVSDAEFWSSLGKPLGGYQSDTHAISVDSELRRLQLTGRRLEADFHRSTSSLSKSRRRTRCRSGDHPKDSETIFTVSPPSPCSSSSKFDVIHVYDGLPVLDAQNCGSTTSIASSVVSSSGLRPHCLTPPSSPMSIGSPSCASHKSNTNLLTSASGKSRLLNFLDQLKPQLQADEKDKYFYMDEEARERRAEAQASNVISPVSF
ncbi:unnamed protein product [Calicophoron daubneyi]|uniref:Uncharacterized protein n=1 Tax=Calicophoron daubneyi TaxID=300641 RepID=A0AAV2TT25_CALDB